MAVDEAAAARVTRDWRQRLRTSDVTLRSSRTRGQREKNRGKDYMGNTDTGFGERSNIVYAYLQTAWMMGEGQRKWQSCEQN